MPSCSIKALTWTGARSVASFAVVASGVLSMLLVYLGSGFPGSEEHQHIRMTFITVFSQTGRVWRLWRYHLHGNVWNAEREQA